MSDEKGSGVAWLALLVGIIALLLSWSTYNRTSDVRLEDKIKTEVDAVIERITIDEMRTATTTPEQPDESATTTDDVIEE